MFSHLTDFAYTRTAKEALGFYIAWFFVILFFCGICGVLYGLIAVASFNQTYAQVYTSGVAIGSVMAFLFCGFFVIKVARAKKMLSDFKTVLLVLCTLLLSALGGSVFGLIIPAYLTTKQSKSETHTEETPHENS